MGARLEVGAADEKSSEIKPSESRVKADIHSDCDTDLHKARAGIIIHAWALSPYSCSFYLYTPRIKFLSASAHRQSVFKTDESYREGFKPDKPDI